MNINVSEHLPTDIAILHCVEAGSRAWGMASHDSDFDVRYIYHLPWNDYLKLETPSDVRACFVGDDYDFVGWDIYKALRLLRKSNVSLLEHLRSPMIYIDDDGFSQELLNIAQQHWSPKRLAMHHLGLAQKHVQKYIAGRQNASVKKMLYVLRSVLCAEFIIKYQEWPPVLFPELIRKCEEFACVGVHQAQIFLPYKLSGKVEEEKLSTIQFPHIDMHPLCARARALPNPDFPIAPLEKFLGELRTRG